MSLALIVTNLILILLTDIAIFYPAHLKYPFKLGKKLTTEQLFAIRWRASIYLLLMFGISLLISYQGG